MHSRVSSEMMHKRVAHAHSFFRVPCTSPDTDWHSAKATTKSDVAVPDSCRHIFRPHFARHTANGGMGRGSEASKKNQEGRNKKFMRAAGLEPARPKALVP